MKTKALDGIIVLDLTRVLAGPYCTMVLGDLGAEIIKVETPQGGDDSRSFTPFLDDTHTKSAYFVSINCGKKSVALNLKAPEGKEAFSSLIQKADVLVENFRPGTLERLGFSEEKLNELNPSLVYATASGFGHSGPDSKKAAYDVIVQACSGLMSITGTEDGTLVRVGASISDIVTGMFTAIGIISALFRREKTGDAARLDIAMLDSTVAILENAIARYQVDKKNPGPIGTRHPSITPFESFKAADGEIVIAAGNDLLFSKLCECMEIPEFIIDERFKTNALRTQNAEQLKLHINKVLHSNTIEYWQTKLSAAGVPCSKINKVSNLFNDPQLHERNMLVPVEGEDDFKVAGSPVKFKNEPQLKSRQKAPELGEHTCEVLSRFLKMSDSEIQDLLDKGVIKSA